MAVMSDQLTVQISMEAACCGSDLAPRLHEQLSGGGYDWPCSVLPLPASASDWMKEHRTARRRSWRCEEQGYVFAEIDRRRYEDDVYEINTSSSRRQGRPMSDGYLARPEYGPLPDYRCERHAIRTYGVLDADGVLRAYTWVYRVGQLVMFSTILGHRDHLDRHVMYLLVRGALEKQIGVGDGVAFYNRHDSGTDGLKFFKERCGFRPGRVEWELG